MHYTREIRSRADVEAARRTAGEYARDAAFSPERAGEALLICSELATNMLDHAGGGRMTLRAESANGRTALRMEFSDEGPGVADADRAMTIGYTTRGGLGEGLPLAHRLADHFELRSTPAGTQITVLIWDR